MTSSLLLVLVACSEPDFNPKIPDDSATDTGVEDTGTDTSPDTSDTVDTDGDLDRDGFSVEEGDCDDDDVRVSPVREEDDDDGRDNDCDGRVDESFSGVTVAYANGAGASDLVIIDSIGRMDDMIRLQGDCSPMWIDHLAEGYAVNCGQTAVASVDADGLVTPLADFSETDFGVWGLTTGPEGSIYAVTVDSLQRIGGDGVVEELARWTVSFEDLNAHELAATGVDIDWATGEVGLFDYFGGFATWTETGGLVVHKKGNWMEPALMSFTGARKDGAGARGAWMIPATDAATGAYGIYAWDAATNDWSLQTGWSDEDWTPFMLAVEGETGDSYVTANAGWFYTVWRIVAGSGYAADLFVTDGTVRNRAFQGIVINE